MNDMLVKLYTLPGAKPEITRLAGRGIIIRTPSAYEKLELADWVQTHFSRGWAGECDVAFSNRPVSCFIATQQGKIIGFACYDCTFRNFFGPIGVEESQRDRSIGKTLLLACLEAMRHLGYAYAIIGSAEQILFYQKMVNAVVIENSAPGIYIDKLKGKGE